MMQLHTFVHLLSTAKCPDCDGSGQYELRTKTNYITSEMAQDAGDPSMAGMVYSVETTTVQCMWCWHRKELLQILNSEKPVQTNTMLTSVLYPKPLTGSPLRE